MDKTQKIFGRQTIQDWIDIRTKIIATPSTKSNWQSAIDLLELRLETRYFRPIERILNMRITTGEGFAVMTLVCSLVEFLQSCYEGKTFVLNAKETKYEYWYSGEKFKAFLTSHDPFKTIFSKPVSKPDNKIKIFADDFYSNVRCSLLHEAATKNNWIIKTSKSSSDKSCVDISNENSKIIYRDNFVDAVKEFIKTYKKEILSDKRNGGISIRENFARKIDSLCDIRDTAFWWT